MATGQSLHIGMNYVDPDAYGGWDGHLEACINDATSMEKLAATASFSTTLLTDGDATDEAVFTAIADAAVTLTDGDIFLLTYAGHGGQLEDLTADEDDALDETWLLWNREVLDDEIYVALSQFAAGVRVLVLSDSCHSGTVLRQLYTDLTEEVPAIARAFDRVGSTLRSRLRTRAAKQLAFRSAPDDVQEAVMQANGDLYRAIRAQTKTRRDCEVAASAILISGCQDNQLSGEQNGHGLFTAALLQVVGEENEAGFGGDHPELRKQIAAKLPVAQSPNYFVVGAPWPEFEAQVPFTIDAPYAVEPEPVEPEPVEPVEPEVIDVTEPVVSTGPAVTVPSEVCRTDSAPSFTVSTGVNKYYVVEVTADPGLFDSTYAESRTESCWYSSWDDPDAPCRYTESVYWLPDDAWANLKENERLWVRIGTTPAEDTWVDYEVSTPDDCGTDAPSFSIIGADDRAMRRSLILT